MKKYRFIFLLISYLLFEQCLFENSQNDKDADDDSSNVKQISIVAPRGKKLFENNCGACHFPDKKMTGPPFQNIREDYDLKWIADFIRNNAKLQANNDVRALYTSRLYYGALMPVYPTISDSDIVAILDYVDSYPVLNQKYYAHRKISIRAMQDSLDKWKR